MSQFIIPLDLRALALDAFGRSPFQRYQLPPAGQPEQAQPKSLAQLPPAQPDNNPAGLLNLPLFAPATFYEVATGDKPVTGADGSKQQPHGPALLTLTDPIVQVAREAVIVSTSIQGRTGQVKEYIGNGDYTISFKGVLASAGADNSFTREYPTGQVQQLRELSEKGKTLFVACRLLQPLGITNVVVKRLSLPPMPGFTNLQAYELECVSDEPIELTLTTI